jgi:uncharacterized membrane protein required for colicin V production
MNVLTLLFLVAVAFFAFQGYRRGVLPLLFRLLSLAGAYISAYLFTPSLGTTVNQNTQLNGIMGYVVAGVGVFILASLLLDLIFTLVKRTLNTTKGAPTQASRIGGAVLGSVVGAIVGLLLVWVSSLANQLLSKEPSANATIAAHPISGIEKLSRKITSGAIRSAINATTQQEDLADFTAQLLEQPEIAISHFRQVIDSEEFNNLFLTQRNQSVLNRGNLTEISRLPEFKQLLKNPGFIALTQNWFKENSDTRADIQIAEKVRDLWARAQFVKQDKEVLAIVNDPQLKSAIEQANVIQLLNDERIVQLFRRIASKEADAFSLSLREKEYKQINLENSSPASNSSLKESESSSPDKPIIYRWVDKHGRVHYSDKKPEDQ